MIIFHRMMILKKMRMIDCEAFQTRPSLTIFTQKIGGVAEPITAEAQTPKSDRI